jgi:alkylation response protein AidB-like acyl-CoA dehydrogenase/predicted cupin superfamily sugar epimerase
MVDKRRRPRTAELLDLAPHPEGGWYRETWRAAPESVPDGYPGPRAAATGIYFLLGPGEESAWHRVRSDEVWLWHSGGPLTLLDGGGADAPADIPAAVALGPDLADGQRPQHVIPAGHWQSARPAATAEVLVSCVVAPGFDFADFSLFALTDPPAPQPDSLTTQPDSPAPPTGRPGGQNGLAERIMSTMSIDIIGIASPDLGRLPEVTRALAARAEQNDRTADFPADGIRAVHAAGLLTATVARRYGGPGAGLADTARILNALGRGDPSVALVTAMTLFAHAGQGARPTWPDNVYQAALDESVATPVLINALRVEPELGTPARGGLPKTVARGTEDGWAVTGRKIFSTGAVGLRWMAVWARTDDAEPRVGSFLVRNDAPGITIERTWDHLGLRASRSDDVTFDETPAVPARLDAPPGPALAQMSWNALGLSALYLGVASAARDWLITFLSERTPAALGAPLATLPRFQQAVGEIESALNSAADLVDALARRVDEGDETASGHATAVKLIATRAAISSVEQAVALTGNNGLTRKNPLERHLRDVLCARVHTPQEDSITVAAGRAALGL